VDEDELALSEGHYHSPMHLIQGEFGLAYPGLGHTDGLMPSGPYSSATMVLPCYPCRWVAGALGVWREWGRGIGGGWGVGGYAPMRPCYMRSKLGFDGCSSHCRRGFNPITGCEVPLSSILLPLSYID
jgi:hypothetical protein